MVVRLTRLVTVLGGPDYRITYPNGDEAACVPIVYEAEVESGSATPDGDETSEVGWFHGDDLAALELNDLNSHLLAAVLPLLGSTGGSSTRSALVVPSRRPSSTSAWPSSCAGSSR